MYSVNVVWGSRTLASLKISPRVTENNGRWVKSLESLHVIIANDN